MYADGSYDNQRTDMYTYTVGNSKASIGGHFSNVAYINGQIDEMIIEKGFSGTDILEGLSEALIDSGERDKDVARLIIEISDADSRLPDATSERIQLEKLISTFS